MILSYFPNQVALNSKPVLDAFLFSCRKQGWTTIENSMNADCAMIWSVLWSGRMKQNKTVYEHYRSQGKPVFILEVGTLIRNVTWRVCLNHINRLGIFGDSLINKDRPKKLGLELKNHISGNDILIACQHETSLQWKDNPPLSIWLNNLIDKLRMYSDRKIIVRPHPRNNFTVPQIPNVEYDHPCILPGSYDDFNVSFNYHAIINFNSSIGVHAAINNVPIISDVSSLAWPVSNKIEDIESPRLLDRHEWFFDLCHKEYLVDEIAQGIPLEKLIPYLQI